MEAAEYQSKAQAFMDRVEAAIGEVFDIADDGDRPVVVIGLQFGDMGKDGSNLPTCVVSSNLPICLVGEAIHDMHDEAILQHDAYHAESGDNPLMVTDPADVPEEVRDFAATLAETLGVPVENIQFRSSVDTTDLSDESLPDWLKGSDIAEAMTGGDIAAAGLGLSDEDVAALREEEQNVLDSQDPEQEV